MNIYKWWARLRSVKQILQRSRELSQEGKHGKARQLLRNAIAIYPNAVALKFELARSLFTHNKVGPAMELMAQGGITAEVDTKEFFELAHRLEHSKHYGHAMGLYQLIADQYANDREIAAEAYLGRTLLLRRRGQKKACIEELIKCIECSELGEAAAMLHSFDTEHDRMELLRLLPRLEKLTKLPNRKKHRLHMILSDIIIKSDDFDRAAVHVGKARDATSWQGIKRSGTAAGARPRFVIIGTAKSGTTALYSSLANHPQVRGAIRKEIHYFNRPEATEAWYLAHFPRLPRGSDLITGEASPSYFAYPIQERMKQALPGVKLICILRNPTRRSISQYFHGRRHGTANYPIKHYFDLRPIRQMLKQTDDEIENELFNDFVERKGTNIAVAFSLYYYYLRRWFRHFDQNQLLLVTLDEFKKRRQETLNKVCEFIGIDAYTDEPRSVQYKGKYDEDAPELQQIIPELDDLFREPTLKLEQAYGIQLGDT